MSYPTSDAVAVPAVRAMPSSRVFVLVNLLVALTLLLVVWMQLAADRRAVLEDAYRDVENLSGALAEHTRQTFSGIDLALSTLAGQLGRETSPDPDRLHALLAAPLGVSPAVVEYFLLDAEGRLKAHSGPERLAPLDLSDYPEFRIHRQNLAAGLHLGTPRKGRVGDGQDRWVFNLTRRIETPEGDFAGVVVAAVSIERLQAFHSALRTGADGVVGVLSPEGIVVARSPMVEGIIGRDVSGSPLFRQTLRDGFRGRLMAAASTDAVRRVSAFQRVPEGSALVYVGLGHEELLAGWRQRAWFQAGTAALAWAMFAAASYAVWVHLRRRRHWEARRSARLKVLADASAELARAADIDTLRDRLTQVARTVLGAQDARTLLDIDDALPMPDLPRAGTTATLSDAADRTRLSVPILGQAGRRLGEVQVACKARGLFTDDDRSELAQLASLAGAALEGLRAAQAREEALRALLAEQVRVEEILTSISDAVYALDPDWRFVYLNAEAERLLERHRAQLLGQCVWDAFPETVDTVLQVQYEQAVASGTPCSFEFFYPPLQRWFSVRAFPHGGGLTAYFLDVTQLRETEERLRQAQKMEAVGQLTGGVAHDFNNLLTVILGNADTLVDQLAGAAPGVRAQAEGIRDAGERAAVLTKRLLAFARKQPLDPRAVDIADLVAEAEGILRRSLGEAIDIELVRGSGLWQALVDPHELQNAILNLAINARDAMPQGGRLTIESANVSVDADYAQANQITTGQYVMVAVSDTGEGMAAQTVARAFEPFYTTKPPGRGSGLGLSQVYGFARQSGGHARIYSEPGEGTTVKIFLPRAGADSVPHVQHARQAGPPPKGRARVLLVEDDPLVRSHTVERLEALGYDVVSCQDGPEALEHLDQGAVFDLLLTDVVLPAGLSGRQVAAEAQLRLPRLAVLYMSGYTENAIVHHGRLDPGVHLLSKPFRQADLAHKLREVLARD